LCPFSRIDQEPDRDLVRVRIGDGDHVYLGPEKSVVPEFLFDALPGCYQISLIERCAEVQLSTANDDRPAWRIADVALRIHVADESPRPGDERDNHPIARWPRIYLKIVVQPCRIKPVQCGRHLPGI